MGKKWGILVLILLLLVPAVYANQGSTKLLALITKGDTQYGTAATLDLDIQQGQNRVFLEKIYIWFFLYHLLHHVMFQLLL